KAYSSRATRKTLRRRGIKTVIPEPRNQQQHRRNRGSRGGRPVNLDVEAYRGRNVIERGYSDVKQWRGLATRYDKLGLTSRAVAVLRAFFLWFHHLLERRALGARLSPSPRAGAPSSSARRTGWLRSRRALASQLGAVGGRVRFFP